MHPAGSRSRAARTPNRQAKRLSPPRHGLGPRDFAGRPGEHHPSLPEVRQGQDHQSKGPPSHRSPHRDRQIAGQREQSNGPSPRCAITLPPQKTSTRHSDQQCRNKDSGRNPTPITTAPMNHLIKRSGSRAGTPAELWSGTPQCLEQTDTSRGNSDRRVNNPTGDCAGWSTSDPPIAWWGCDGRIEPKPRFDLELRGHRGIRRHG